MSVPILSDPASLGVTSRVTGLVSFNWISEAWRLFSAQMGVWILTMLVFAAPLLVFFIVFYALMWATMFPGGLPTAAQPSGGSPFPAANPALMGGHVVEIFIVEIGFGLLYSMWSAYLYGGLFRMAVRQVRGLPIEVQDVFRGGSLFGRMLGAIFLLGIGAYGLEALCVAPLGLVAWQHGPMAGMIVSGLVGGVVLFVLMLALTGMLLPSFALMADGDGVFTAIKRSLQAMKNAWPAAAGFVFVLGLLVYASELLCGIGLLATIPMVFLITALAYRDMLGMPNMMSPPVPVYAQAQAGVWPPPPTESQPSQSQFSEREKGTDA